MKISLTIINFIGLAIFASAASAQVIGPMPAGVTTQPAATIMAPPPAQPGAIIAPQVNQQPAGGLVPAQVSAPPSVPLNYSCAIDTSRLLGIPHNELRQTDITVSDHGADADWMQKFPDSRYYAQGSCKLSCFCQVSSKPTRECVSIDASMRPSPAYVCPNILTYGVTVRSDETETGSGTSSQAALNDLANRCATDNLYVVNNTVQQVDCQQSCKNALTTYPPSFIEGGFWDDDVGYTSFSTNCTYPVNVGF